MTMRSKQWYTKTSRLEYSFAKGSIGRRSSDRVLTTRSSVRRPVESKFQIYLARIYVPDLAFVCAPRNAHLPDYADRASDVMIEIVSPPESAARLTAKVEFYLQSR